MKIQFYGYNAFLIESGDKLLAIDPGALFFSGLDLLRFSPSQNGKILPTFSSHTVTRTITGTQTEWQKLRMRLLFVIKQCCVK